MPKIQHTVIRGGKYYMRIRVPTDLIKSMGRTTILRTLKTADPWEAKKRLNLELAHIHAEFDSHRKKLQSIEGSQVPLDSLSDSEIVSLVLKWTRLSYDKSRDFLPEPYDWEEVNQTLLEEEGDISRALMHKDYSLGASQASQILDEKGVCYERDSKDFVRLAETLTRAELELTTLLLQRHNGEPITGTGDKFFSSLLTQNLVGVNISRKKKIDFGTLCSSYLKDRKENVRERVLRGIKEEVAVLQNFIAPDTDLHEIDHEKCRDIFELIKKLPAHASKVYPNINIRKAIDLSERDGSKKIGSKRVNTFMVRLRAIFSFGIDEGYINSNPVSKKLQVKDKRMKKNLRDPFSIDQLQSIFSAPLYTGCQDDEYGYNKPGDKQPRRARFWVPLIALWTGMRLEEICQLDTADIRNIEGVHVIEIFQSEDKALKTESAARSIPIHAELKKIGFLKYVQEIRDKEHKKLFPELSISSTGNYSQPFSKWFGRFLDTLEIADTKLCFHSLRHNFRDTLREAELPSDYVRALGGWAGSSVMDNYGKGEKIAILEKYHSRITYSGLDLSHLYLSQPISKRS